MEEKMSEKSRSGLRFDKGETWPGAWSLGTGVIQFSGSGKTDCLAVIKNPPGFSVG